MDSLREKWEVRARECGDRIDGVLYRGLPPALNQQLDEQHGVAVREQLLPLVPKGGLVLDVGCGYGRLSALVLEARPDLRVVGVDLAHPYALLFQQRLGQDGICARFSALPFPVATFDALIACTVLMYAAPLERESVLRRMLETLKPGGHALLVDPSSEFMRLAALAAPSSRDTPTGGHWFTHAEYARLGQLGTTVKTGGLPVFSLLLPLLLVLSRLGVSPAWLLRLTARLDRRWSRFARWSIHRWMVVRRT